MRSLDPDALLQALREGAAVFDTRPPALAARLPLPGARPLSLQAVQQGRFPPLPPDAAIVLVCEHGQVSRLVAMYLEAAGFRDVGHLAGGLRALRARTAPGAASAGRRAGSPGDPPDGTDAS